MPCHLIITVGAVYENEMHQSALALYWKIKAKTDDVYWYDVVIGGKEPAFVQLLGPEKKPKDFNDGAVYAISHGSKNKFAGLDAHVFSGYLELFLVDLGMQKKTVLDKLCVMACNVGKAETKEFMVKPSDYLVGIAKSFKICAFAKIIAWNSWVTIYSFRSLIDFCKTHQDVIVKNMEKCLKPMLESKHSSQVYEKLIQGMNESKQGSGRAQPFKSAMAKEIVSKFQNATLDEVMKLVGKRLVDREGLSSKQKVFSSYGSMGLNDIMKSYVKPQATPLFSTERDVQVLKALSKLVGLEVATLIVEYEAVAWIYYPTKMKLCYMPTIGQGFDGLDKL